MAGSPAFLQVDTPVPMLSVATRALPREERPSVPKTYSRLVSRSFECVPHQLLFIACHLFWTKFERQLVDFAGEAERKLIAVVYRRAGVAPDVKRFVDGHKYWNCMGDGLSGHQLAINRQHTGATLAWARAVILEVEHNRMLAGLERIAKQVATSYASFPAEPLQIEHVVRKDRLAFEQVKGVSAETTAQRHDHSFGAPCRYRHVGRDRVILVQDARCIAERNAGVLTRIGENRSPGGRARARRHQARNDRVIQ